MILVSIIRFLLLMLTLPTCIDIKLLHLSRSRSFTVCVSPRYHPARSAWGFCLKRDSWGSLSARCRWRIRLHSKGFFLRRSHIGAIWETAVPPPAVSKSISPVRRAAHWFMAISKGNGAHRSGAGRRSWPGRSPLLTLSFAAQMAEILEQRSYALLSQVTPTDRGGWLSSVHRFNLRGGGPACQEGM